MQGRNDPCHCGSGKKYKLCHLPKERVLREAQRRGENPRALDRVRELAIAMESAQQEHLRRYGHVREAIHADFQGHKFVAVGNELHYSAKWRNFTDFLLSYVKTTLSTAFGPDWYPAERAKSPEKRHPIVRWYEAFCELGAKAGRNAEGLLEADADGPTQAYLNLAYDLYVVRHNARLQREVLKRLRTSGHFHGARHELAVAATMIRAGFEIDFEDESDGSRRHPEFIATYRATGARVAVEAKARRRSGVMGWVGPRQDPSQVQLSVDDLLRNACEKESERPLIVFIDANMPPEMANSQMARWLGELNESLPRVAHGFSDVGVFEGAPYALLVLTNTPYDYAGRGQNSASAGVLMSVPVFPRRPLPEPRIQQAIEQSLKQLGRIPKEFPVDPRDSYGTT